MTLQAIPPSGLPSVQAVDLPLAILPEYLQALPKEQVRKWRPQIMRERHNSG
jgi:hypothetical protein